jgi:hypothetical protein
MVNEQNQTMAEVDAEAGYCDGASDEEIINNNNNGSNNSSNNSNNNTSSSNISSSSNTSSSNSNSLVPTSGSTPVKKRGGSGEGASLGLGAARSQSVLEIDSGSLIRHRWTIYSSSYSEVLSVPRETYTQLATQHLEILRTVNAVLDREYAQRRAKLLWKKAIAKVIFLNRCSSRD